MSHVQWENMPFRATGDQRTHVVKQAVPPTLGAPGGTLLTYCRLIFRPDQWDAGQTHGKYPCAECYRKAPGGE